MAGAGGATFIHDTGDFTIMIGSKIGDEQPGASLHGRIRGFGRWLEHSSTGIATTIRQRFVAMRAAAKDFPNDCFPKLVFVAAMAIWGLVLYFRVKPKSN